jgi:hypothetical protein
MHRRLGMLIINELVGDIQGDLAPDRLPPGFQSGSQIPLDALGPGESYAIPMTNPYGMAAAIIAELHWHDGTGEREKIAPLSLAAS